jgi:hypothetical protein
MAKPPPTAADFDFLDKQISKLREDLNELWRPFDRLKTEYDGVNPKGTKDDLKALENVVEALAKRFVKLETTVTALVKHAAAKK